MADRDQESGGRYEDYGRYGKAAKDRPEGSRDESRSWSGGADNQSYGRPASGGEGGQGPLAHTRGRPDQSDRSPSADSLTGRWDRGDGGSYEEGEARYSSYSSGNPQEDRGGDFDRGGGGNRRDWDRKAAEHERAQGEDRYSSYSAGNPQEDRGGGFEESWRQGDGGRSKYSQDWNQGGLNQGGQNMGRYGHGSFQERAQGGQGGGSYRQQDVSPGAQRSQWRQPQHFGDNGAAAESYAQQSGNTRDHDHDPAYRRWRDQQLSTHDSDYARWRDEQARRYDEQYKGWRDQRHEAFSQDFHDWRSKQAQGLAGDDLPGGGAHMSGAGASMPQTSAGEAGKDGKTED